MVISINPFLVASVLTNAVHQFYDYTVYPEFNIRYQAALCTSIIAANSINQRCLGWTVLISTFELSNN